jgi:pimeloyl-ACP methyl ester carboxylesterase
MLVAIATAVGLLVATLTGSTFGSAAASDDGHTEKPTIVLVHGSFADASTWNDVTAKLQRDGYTVLAPANPLRGVDSDTAYLRSVLDTIDGPVVLVGHSYGGFVMTNAAEGNPNVQGLVYVAGFAPAAGETVEGLNAMNPGSGLAEPGNLVIRPHSAGADAYINPTAFRDIVADDLSHRTTRVMASSQRPADIATVTQASGDPAWDDIPSWYVVATEDGALPPATQRFMAERAGSTTVEVRSSHLAMMSRPRRVTSVIEDAAATAG